MISARRKTAGLLAAAFFAAATLGYAQGPPAVNTAGMTEWRQDFHKHPEIAGGETRTAAKVARLLRSWNIETHEGVGGTGVVGVLHGKGAGPAIALRADMDALPLNENPGQIPYASQNPGVMHACGHDGHTAMLLGAAEYLAQTRNFAGTVLFVFQPAEETGEGALAMMRDGLFTRFKIDAIYGMHAWPGLPVGTIGVTEGPVTAASDTYEITVTGKGGHAAYPGLAVNPVNAAAKIVTAIEKYKVKGEKDAVFGVTNIHGGEAPNVIPDRVTLSGTVRTFTPAARDKIEKELARIAAKIAKDYGASAKLSYERGEPPVVNAKAQSAFALAAAREASQKVEIFGRTMAAEDFARYLDHVPGAYVALGQAEPGKPQAFLHNFAFDFNDNTLKIGATYWIRLVERALSLSTPAPRP